METRNKHSRHSRFEFIECVARFLRHAKLKESDTRRLLFVMREDRELLDELGWPDTILGIPVAVGSEFMNDAILVVSSDMKNELTTTMWQLQKSLNENLEGYLINVWVSRG